MIGNKIKYRQVIVKLLSITFFFIFYACTSQKSPSKPNLFGGKGGDGGKAENGKDGEAGKDGKNGGVNIKIKQQ